MSTIDDMIESWAARRPPTPTPPSPPPAPKIAAAPEAGAKTPKTLPCGHTDWYGEEVNAEARARDLCCAGAGESYAAVDWRVRGIKFAPVPKHLRRVAGGKPHGFPGFCCNADGYYIGGVGNHCIFYGEKQERCPEHAG